MKYDLSRCTHSREAFGEALVHEAERNQDIVVVDGDVSNSTKTDRFAREFPDRFINVGIAEQNMVNIAAGLARSGKIPFVSTFPVFGCGRAWEQIRNTVALDSLNVKLVMTHAGLSLGGDGATHQGLEDIAVMRVIPNMQVIVPADGPEVRSVTRYAVEHPGPVYIRLSRRRTLTLFDDGYTYRPGDYPVVRDGEDVAIFASGCMIREALIAADRLEKGGISARILDMHTVKPLARDCILRHARETGRVVSVEEHSTCGGAGGALAELLAEELPVPMKRVGVQDRFGRSGSVDALFDLLGISAPHIAGAVQALMKKGRR